MAANTEFRVPRSDHPEACGSASFPDRVFGVPDRCPYSAAGVRVSWTRSPRTNLPLA